MTNAREVAFALAGAVFGGLVPLALHGALSASGYEAELCGMPMAVLALPGFFLGAILGARRAR